MFAATTALVVLAGLAGAQNVLYEASDMKATVYYDIDPNGDDVCSQAKGGPFPNNWAVTSGINTGVTYCQGSDSTAWTLNDIHSNRIVAMNYTMVSGDKAKWCGKEVQIFGPDGNEITIDEGPFVLFDGCAACQSTGIIDVSAKAFVAIKGGTCGGNNPTGLSVKILDSQQSVNGYSAGSPVAAPPAASSAAPPAASSAAPAESAAPSGPANNILVAEPSEAAPSTSADATPTAVPNGFIESKPVNVPEPTASAAALPEASKAADEEAGCECEFGKWSCEGNQIQVCNWGPEGLDWETVGHCDNACFVSGSGSITCN